MPAMWPNARGGSVLILVLVVVAMLTLGAYTFSEIMLSESEATAMFGRQAESRAFAYSGVEHVTAVLGYPETPSDANVYHNPLRYQAILMRDAESTRGRGYFSVVAATESDVTATSTRFGLIDESGKLNLNQIMSDQFGFEDDETLEREMLMFLPNMTPEIADAILDWIDDDDIPRTYGVESDYYQSIEPPYYAKNAPLESVDELLMIAGVSPELLYGEDKNRNGLLDPNENDGEASLPLDNADGILDVGWAAYLTTNSKELNQRSDGEEKIFVNTNDLKGLYESIVEALDEDTARFIIAYRLYGSPNTDGPESESETNEASSDATEPAEPGATSNQNDSNNPDNNERNNSREPEAQNDFTQALTTLGDAMAGGVGDQPVTVAGFDVREGGKVDIKSLYELIGVVVEVPAEEEEDGQGNNASGESPPAEVIESPFADDPSSMESYLPQILDMLTTVDDKTITGRINVNQARYEVLMGVPGMTEDVALSISQSSMVGADGAVTDDQLNIRATNGWLVTQGIVDLQMMIEFDKFLTGGGDVYRAQVVGYFEEGGGHTRLEAVLDATESPVKIVRVSDLSELGRGYRQDILNGTVAE